MELCRSATLLPVSFLSAQDASAPVRDLENFTGWYVVAGVISVGGGRLTSACCWDHLNRCYEAMLSNA
jgi:hypothetical protein